MDKLISYYALRANVLFLLVCCVVQVAVHARSMLQTGGFPIPSFPLCRGDEHSIGEWKYDATKTNKSFVCCGWDDHGYLDRPNECYHDPDKSLSFHDYYAGVNGLMQLSGGHSCTCEKGSPHSLHANEVHTWKPHRCNLTSWNSVQFCKLLGNRHVLILGDSLSAQSATTLMNMISYGNGGCAHQIYFDHRNELTTHERKGDLVATLINYFKFKSPSKPLDVITVMNAGAHFQDLGDMYTTISHLKTMIPEARRQIQKRGPGNNITFVWRSQTPGHYNCDYQPNISYPVIDEKNDFYRYGLFPYFDAMAKEVSSELNIVWMDVFPLYLRNGAHPAPDCLHWCLPGPLDLIPILLMHKLFTKEI